MCVCACVYVCGFVGLCVCLCVFVCVLNAIIIVNLLLLLSGIIIFIVIVNTNFIIIITDCQAYLARRIFRKQGLLINAYYAMKQGLVNFKLIAEGWSNEVESG